MNLSPGQARVLKALGVGALLYGSFRLLRGDKPVQAVKKTVQVPVEAVKATLETAKEVVDVVVHPIDTVNNPVRAVKNVADPARKVLKRAFSPAQIAQQQAFAAKAKERAAARRAGKTITPDQKPSETSDMVMALRGKKGGEATAKLGPHKGHKSKAGLSQDQKLASDEPHEKAWRHLR